MVQLAALTRNTLATLILSKAWVAATPGCVVLGLTVCVDATRQRVARVDTLVVDTSQLSVTLLIH